MRCLAGSLPVSTSPRRAVGGWSAHPRRLAALVERALAHAYTHAHGPSSEPAPLRQPGRQPQVAGQAPAVSESFAQLFARHYVPLVDYLYGMTRDREAAADLAQETFARALAATSDPGAIMYPQAWLYRIATNLTLTTLSRRRRFGWLPLVAVEPETGGNVERRAWLPRADLPYPDLAATVAERDAVWSVLAELPPRWRAVLLLQAAAGFEVREIAAQLGLSETNVRKILFRAKERFRERYRRLDTHEAQGGAR